MNTVQFKSRSNRLTAKKSTSRYKICGFRLKKSLVHDYHMCYKAIDKTMDYLLNFSVS